MKDLNRKGNYLLCAFHAADPFVKCYLLKSFCLSLFGCSLWSLSSSSIRVIEVALNKLLRKLWNLPRNSHSSIVHCVAEIDTISSMVYSRFCSRLSTAVSSSSSLVRSVLIVSSQVVYSFTGYNYFYGIQHLSVYNSSDFTTASFIRHLRHLYGLHSPCEGIICRLSSL